ncbi:MAG: RloB domain-containing protein [Acidimicrobiales bacterium]|nr:RloB domain-containing protein [Acidimicrobiales bacterium]
MDSLGFLRGRKPTEQEYINALKSLPLVREIAAVDIRVEPDTGGLVPKTLVSKVVEARRRNTGEESEIDEIWCVFDLEWPTNHPDLNDSGERARQAGIKVAISNPCFELWLILHFQDHYGFLLSADVISLRRQLDGLTGKGLDPSIYMPSILNAVNRASELNSHHLQNDTAFPHNNPSSGMYQLLRSVLEAADP